MTDFDLVVYGATGFTGKLVAEYLAGLDSSHRIALAGRSQWKLESVRDDLGVDWPVLVADAADPKALTKLAKSTTALVTTVGPYWKYGLPLVEACAKAGTHYADLAGEVLFMRESIERRKRDAEGGVATTAAVGGAASQRDPETDVDSISLGDGGDGGNSSD